MRKVKIRTRPLKVNHILSEKRANDGLKGIVKIFRGR
jgi:hypothetical protein